MKFMISISLSYYILVYILVLNTIRQGAEHMNSNSDFPTFGVIALCVFTIFVSAPYL